MLESTEREQRRSWEPLSYLMEILAEFGHPMQHHTYPGCEPYTSITTASAVFPGPDCGSAVTYLNMRTFQCYRCYSASGKSSFARKKPLGRSHNI